MDDTRFEGVLRQALPFLRKFPWFENMVVVESPFAGDIETNLLYARACVADCIQRGENPYASHLFFTQPGILRDDVPEEREKGITYGFHWGVIPSTRAIYVDRGISSGMRWGSEQAPRWHQTVEERRIPGWENGLPPGQ